MADIETGVKVGVDSSQAAKAINELKNKVDGLADSFSNVSKQVDDVIKHLENLNKKSLGNINKQINNVTQNRNIASQNIDTNYDFGSARNVAKNSSGSVMTSDTGRGKVFRDYQQAIVDETNATRKDIEERTRLRALRANTEKQRADNNAAAISKREDKSTDAYIADRAKIAEAKLLNAKAKQAGALNRDWSYQIGRGLQGAGGVVSQLGVGGQVAGGALNILGGILKAPATGFATALIEGAKAVTDFSRAALTAYAEIEATKTNLGVVYSSQTQADAAFGQLADYAVKSPFGVQQTSELAILLKQSGVYASDLMDTLRMLGDTAGGNMEKMKRIANNYAQIVSIGKASMLDMRQFAYAGIPIFEAVSKELGVSQQELRKLISDGKVTSDIIEKVFKDLTGINGLFENATEKGAKTLKARLQNLSDAKQLAMASMGEFTFNLGTDTGNDSFANGVVTGIENIYQHLQKSVNTINIEKSVQSIERRDDRLDRISDAIKYLENKKDRTAAEDEILKGLRKNYADELAKFDIEKERSTYNQAYNWRNEGWREYLQAQGSFMRKDLSTEYMEEKIFGTTDENKILQQLESSLEDVEKRKSSKGLDDRAKAQTVKSVLSAVPFSGKVYKKILPDVFSKDEEVLLNALNTQIDELENAIKGLKVSQLTSDKSRQANAETNVIDAQTLYADSIEKMSKEQGSYYSLLQELQAKQKESDEAKLKAEEAHTAELQNAQNALKQLDGHLNDNGIVDMLSFDSLDDLLDLVDKKIFTVERNLAVVESKSAKQMEDDRWLVTDQVKKVVEETVARLDEKGYSLLSKEIIDSFDEFVTIEDNREFYRALPAFLDKTMKKFADLTEQNADSFSKNEAENVLRKLGIAGLQLSTISDVENVDLSKKGKGVEEFIPLWKRILAGATGISANVIKGTNETLESYRDDMAVRNTTSNVIKAMLSSGYGVNSVTSLLRTDGYMKQLRGTDGGTYQIDWKGTREAVKQFSMQMTSSSAVLSAYKEGLESQLGIYEQLLASGITETESQDIQNKKVMSSEAWGKLIKDSGEQLVNAFGEKLQTSSGEIIARISNGNFYLKDGRQMAKEDVRITGNLYEFIQRELPQLRTDSYLASIRLTTNSILEEMKKDKTEADVDASVVSKLLAGGASPEAFSLYEKGREGYLSATVSDLSTRRVTEGGGTYVEPAGQDFISRKLDSFIKDLDDKGKDVEETYRNIREYAERPGTQASKELLSLISIAQYEAQHKSHGENAANADAIRRSELKAYLQSAQGNGKLMEGLGKSYWVEKAEGSTERELTADEFRAEMEKDTDRLASEVMTAAQIAGSDRYLGAQQDATKAAIQMHEETPYSPYFAEKGAGPEDVLKTFGYRWFGGSTALRAGLSDTFSYAQLGELYKPKVTGAIENTVSNLDRDDPENRKKQIEALMKELKLSPDTTEGLGYTMQLGFAGDDLEKQEKILAAMADDADSLAEHLGRVDVGTKAIEASLKELANSLEDFIELAAKDTFLAPFEYLGESLIDSDMAAEDLKANMTNIAADLLKNVGSAMASAGFQIAAAAAIDHNWAGVAAGLALAATGGFASGLGNALTKASEDEDEDEDKLAKLNQMKGDLADLLRQAREDAVYYESTLRHKNALSANDSFTQTKVNDAIITPSGDVISTHPDDYLIATKTPQTILGSGAGSPTINFSVIDKSTGIRVTQQKSTYNEDDNSIDFEAIIESKVQDIIASPKGDDAFNAREARLRGYSVIA